MKYYAVTDDPRELYHYGVKGMKWGQHIFGDKPKSPGYKRAATKLKAAKASKASKTSKVSSSSNRRSKEETKYNNAVKKTQKRISQIEKLYKVDQEKSAYDQVNREYKKAQKLYKAQNKRENRYAKNEPKMDKIMEKARRGKLKYGKLSQDQIERIQDRLNLENQTRRMGSQEKTWRQQKKEARRQGKLLGIQKGTAAAMEELARAGMQFGIQGIRNNILLKNQAKQEGKRQKVRDQQKNNKTRKDYEREMHEEVMRAKVRDVDAYDSRKLKQLLFGKSSAQKDAERLKAIEDKKERKRLEDNRKQLQDDLYRKWLLGNKSDKPEDIADRIAKQDEIRELIYGKSKKLEIPDSNKSKAKRSFEDYDGEDFILVPRTVRKAGKAIDTVHSKINSSLLDENTAHRKAYRRYTDRVKATNSYIKRKSTKK